MNAIKLVLTVHALYPPPPTLLWTFTPGINNLVYSQVNFMH